MTPPNGNGLAHLALNINRTLGTILLGILTWLALQAYDELKGLRSQVSTINQNSAVMAVQLQSHERRLDRLETR